jgi:hypothetical protein
MKNYHAIEISYVAPSNKFDGRVRFYSLRFQQRKYLDRNECNLVDQAVKQLQSWGYKVVGTAETPKGWIILSETFITFPRKGLTRHILNQG